MIKRFRNSWQSLTRILSITSLPPTELQNKMLSYSVWQGHQTEVCVYPSSNVSGDLSNRSWIAIRRNGWSDLAVSFTEVNEALSVCACVCFVFRQPRRRRGRVVKRPDEPARRKTRKINKDKCKSDTLKKEFEDSPRGRRSAPNTFIFFTYYFSLFGFFQILQHYIHWHRRHTEYPVQ